VRLAVNSLRLLRLWVRVYVCVRLIFLLCTYVRWIVNRSAWGRESGTGRQGSSPLLPLDQTRYVSLLPLLF